ncbi:MAG: hypothetical protein LQ341_005028 [Variospora aurantia]|nr:MAG: hypothetical protein LQ341_005028 [Variospora aurantia]
MGIKRKRDDDGPDANAPDIPPKKARKGFSVGPANLPDGTHRRKVKRIKDNLVRKAKVRKSYSKIKEKEPVVLPKYYSEAPPPDPEQPPASMELHPARRAMLEDPPVKTVTSQVVPPESEWPRHKRHRKPKTVPFEKEARLAENRRREHELRRQEAEQARSERQRKNEERERFRKAMAKARTGGKNGQRKLGRESKVLLERVKNIVSD